MLEGVSAPSHRHRLKAENLREGYICDGCKERGTEWRYRCRDCNYDMHNFCATASPSIRHPLTAANMILLSSSVVKDSLWCCACERSVSGLRYYCSASGDALHPCCARLPRTPKFPSITLHLSRNLSEDPCNRCGQRNRGWAYVSRGYNIHVRCCLKEAWESNLSSSRSSPQLSSRRLQSSAAPSASNHQHSQARSNQELCRFTRSNHGSSNHSPLQLAAPSTSDHRRSKEKSNAPSQLKAAPSTSDHRRSKEKSNAPSQLKAAPSTSDHRRSKEESSSWGPLQKPPKRRSNHGVIRAICTTTRLLLKVICALFFGDPSSLVGEFVTLISNN